MLEYTNASAKDKVRFDLNTLPKGVPQRLLTFNSVTGWLDRVDWEYALSSDTSLTPGARILGINIILHINPKDHDCHPSQQMLAARLGCTPRTIVRHIRLLERTGWLVVRRWPPEKREGLRRPANVYRPTIPVALVEAIKVTAVSHRSGDQSDNSRQIKVTPVSPQYSKGINNKKERGLSEEVKVKDDPVLPGREFFVEVESPEWEAWSKIKPWPQRDFRIDGRIRRGWWFRSAWPTSELPPRLNGGAAAITEALG